MNAPPIPLILDTDPALGVVHEGRPRDVDDAFAIVEALRSPQVELLGITVTFGNAPLTAAMDVAATVLRIAAAKVPVLSGAATAMPAIGAPAPTDAVHFLIETLSRRRARIAAIGPLTNIGTLLSLRPDLAAQIDEVVIVAGRTAGRRFYLGDVGPVGDFNFENDVRAAQVLLDAGVPIAMAGFELSSQVAITGSDLDVLHTSATPVALHLERNARDWLGYWTRRFPGDAGFHPWDSAALAWVLRPELFVAEARGARIRVEPLTPVEQARMPAGSRGEAPWLETGVDLPGPRVTFLTGFAPDGDRRFVEAMLASIR